MRHFKWALIITGIGIPLLIGIGLAIVFLIHGSGVPEPQLRARTELLAQGMALLLCVLIGPFWIYGASQFGKERRLALASAKAKKITKKRRP